MKDLQDSYSYIVAQSWHVYVDRRDSIFIENTTWSIFNERNKAYGPNYQFKLFCIFYIFVLDSRYRLE